MNFSNTNLPTRKLAIVTGAAEGCGLAIARNLCRDFDGDVFLTSRNVERGAEAVEKLNTEGFYPKYYRLDINDENQVLGLRDVVEKEYGKLDILVNNAATGYLSPTVAGMAEMAEATFRTNFKSTLRMCQVFIPVMNEGGRIVNMSSRMGRLCLVKNREMREKISSPHLTLTDLDAIMQRFCNDMLAATSTDQPSNYNWGIATRRTPSVSQGWGETSYSVSKLATSAITRILQHEIDSTSHLYANDLLINAGEPGNVKSKLNHYMGRLEPEEGVDTATWLCFLPKNDTCNPRGELCADRQIMRWYDGYFGYPSCNYANCAHKDGELVVPVEEE